jgi:PAS domain-containing protein
MTTSSFDERSTEVKEHERRAAVILDGMYQFVALLNPRGDILEVNRAALDGAGHQIQEIRAKPFWTARWWQVSEQIREDLQRAIRRAAAGEFVRYEVDIYGEQSGLVPITIDFSLQPIRGESGRSNTCSRRAGTSPSASGPKSRWRVKPRSCEPSTSGSGSWTGSRPGSSPTSATSSAPR